ncbi:hypothetical protein SK128_023268, partial [Halocaridina rubra]
MKKKWKFWTQVKNGPILYYFSDSRHLIYCPVERNQPLECSKLGDVNKYEKFYKLSEVRSQSSSVYCKEWAIIQLPLFSLKCHIRKKKFLLIEVPDWEKEVSYFHPSPQYILHYNKVNEATPTLGVPVSCAWLLANHVSLFKDGGVAEFTFYGDSETLSLRPNLSAKEMSFSHASLSLPGSPFNLRRGSRGSHQFTWRTTNGRRFGDKKPLVLSTYLDAQEHLPYADDSAAVTPMSEENGAIIVPVYTNLGSRHNSYTSHTSRISYTSHGDLLNGKPLTTKESQLLSRSRMASRGVPEDSSMEPEEVLALKLKNQEANPFIDPIQKHT